MTLSWSVNTSPLLEFMVLKCWLFYLLREFTAILLVAVNTTQSPTTTGVRHWTNYPNTSVSSRQPTLNPAWDFNHADPKTVFPKLYQHINFPTWGNNTLDMVFTSHRDTYKGFPVPHLCASDHLTDRGEIQHTGRNSNVSNANHALTSLVSKKSDWL